MSQASPAIGLDPSDFFVSATHTHSGGTGAGGLGGEPGQQRLRDAIVEAVIEAAHQLEPVRVAFASTDVDLNVNRDLLDASGDWLQAPNPAGISDKSFAVLSFTANKHHEVHHLEHATWIINMRKIALLAAIALTIGSASPTLAHTHLVRSTPAANQSLPAPATLTLIFNERLAPAFSSAQVTMPAHDMTVPANMRLSRDGKTMTITPRSALGRGSYVIRWTAAGSDGHRMEGIVPFTVR